MKYSRETQTQQTTPNKGGYLQEVGLEPRGNAGALSISPVSQVQKDDGTAYASNLLEKILHRDNLNQAYKQVKRNKGSHGVDGMRVDELLPYLKQNGELLKQEILEGTYRPAHVRRKEISKPDGGVRLLGIPTVVDRMIQQAMAQILTPIFDRDFSESSFGFRPGRNAHQAILKAREHISEGYNWVVDMDLEKYFDTVNHDKLMALVARKIKDKRVLKLIRLYLNSGVMLNGIVIDTEKGCPQGGPLSPLLSNIMLDELDKELEKRGHRFCRYADDSNVYLRSKKAAERVLRNITKYLENNLKLKVNREKSKVDRPWRRKFLGFSFYIHKDGIGIRVHPKSISKFKQKIREITSRSNGKSMRNRMLKLRQLITGWVAYFKIADMKEFARNLDQWIRRRLRMCYWKQWKRIKTKHDNLVKLGIENSKAWEHANTRKGYWRAAGSHILSCTLTNEILKKHGFLSLTERYAQVR